MVVSLRAARSIVGRPAMISWEVGDSRFEYRAEIRRVGAEIASTTGGIDAFAVVEAGGEPNRLRPGAFVSVSLPDMAFDAAIQAPDTALYRDSLVYVVEDGRLASREVDLLGYAGSDVLIRSTGDPVIRDGDQIVTTQLREAGPGSKVIIR